MIRMLLRQLLLATVALVALLVTRPAFAESRVAPQCDKRAAVTFAPPPTLQLPDASVDVGARDDCVRGWAEHVLRQGRAPSPDASALDVDVTLPGDVTSPAPPARELARELSARDRPRDGVRTSLERPPRG